MNISSINIESKTPTVTTESGAEVTIHHNLTNCDTNRELHEEIEILYLVMVMGYGNTPMVVLTSGWDEADAIEKTGEEPEDIEQVITFLN